MKRLVAWLFKHPSPELELVAQGTDRAFLLWLGSSGLLLLAVLSEAFLGFSLFPWVLGFVGLLGLGGTAAISYSIAVRASRSGWWLGIVPFVLILALYAMYLLWNRVPVNSIYLIVVGLIGTSTCGSIAGRFRHKEHTS